MDGRADPVDLRAPDFRRSFKKMGISGMGPLVVFCSRPAGDSGVRPGPEPPHDAPEIRFSDDRAPAGRLVGSPDRAPVQLRSLGFQLAAGGLRLAELFSVPSARVFR